MPFGKFAPYVALVSVIFTFIALFGLLSLYRKQGDLAWDSPVAGGLLIAPASTLIFGGWSVIFAVGPERDYLSENIGPIADIQSQPLDLQEDVTEIKETSTSSSTIGRILQSAE